ncbi:MAG: glycosyltransferase family 2 protein [Solirubrobacteraceae bacterium]
MGSGAEAARAGPSLCVGIATRNRRELVLGAVESVLRQLGAGDELVVVDNGSTDGTQEVLAAVAKSHGARFRVVAEPDGGVSTARNRVLKEARAGIVCFLDDDALPWPEWLAALRAAWADATPRVAAVGGPIRPLFGKPPPGWLVRHLLYLVGALDLGDRRRVLDQSPAVGYVWGGNMSVRVAAAVEIGGLDPDRGIRPEALGDAGEEEDLQRRLAAAGYEVWYEPAAGIQHLVPATWLTAAHLRRKVRGRALGEARRGARRSSGLALLVRASYRCALALVCLRRASAIEASFGIVRGWTLVTASRSRRSAPLANRLPAAERAIVDAPPES